MMRTTNAMDNITKARTNMVLSQIITTSSVDQLLLDTLLEIPRQLFVPNHLKAVAYNDDHLALGNNRYIMAPATLAKLIGLARVTPQDIVLDIAVTTGYSSAVFSKLAHSVMAVECDLDLASRANFILHSLNIKNVIVISTNLTEGHSDAGHYNVIFFNGAVENIPESLTHQLADGGRLVAVTYDPAAYNPLTHTVLGNITVIERHNNRLQKTELMPITMFPLEEFRKVA